MRSLFKLFSKQVKAEPAIHVDAAMYQQLENELRNNTGLAYILTMAWQGRSDKFSPDRAPMLDWVTKNFVREDLAATYTGFKSRQVHFVGENHQQLAYEAVNKLTAALPNMVVFASPDGEFNF